MRANFWLFADQGDINIADRKATRGDAVHRVFKKNLAIGTFPLWVAGREVAANIALGQRTINGIR